MEFSRVISKLFKTRQFKEINLHDIEISSKTTSFSFPPDSRDLLQSLMESGAFSPVYIAMLNGGDQFTPICGHRRIQAFEELGAGRIPAFILNPSPGNQVEALLFNVAENRSHRSFNEIEISNIISKLKQFGMPEDKIITDVMPFLGLEKNKKIYQGYLSLQRLLLEMKKYLVKIKAPLRLWIKLANWREVDQKAISNIIRSFKPGGNKLRKLVELLEEASLRDGTFPGKILNGEGAASIYQHNDLSPSDKAREMLSWLQRKRYPFFSGKKELMERELSTMIFPKGVSLNYPGNFEGEEMNLSLRFSSAEDFFSGIDGVKSKLGKEKIERLLKLLKE